jgi:flavin reductase (DIM6/NTAB) family NADH-FMN oxidoreductase RutF
MTSSVELPTTVTPDLYRAVFRRYAAGVVVITADAGFGPVGFTATSLA